MKAFINIENDQELRDHVKQLMLGQIKSITREEIGEVIREEIRLKLESERDDNWFRNLVRDRMGSAIEGILRKDFGVGEWQNNFIEPIVSKKINAELKGKDWSAVVDKLATQKIKSMLG